MAFFGKRTAETPQVLQLPIGGIAPNPNQPRRTFSPAELDELANSIAQVGILQPLTVRALEHGWELVAGERRLRAAAQAGLETVPCLVIQADEAKSTLLALDKLIATCGLSQEEAAQRIGKSQSAVANKLRLLRLPPEVLAALRDGGCTERHARALLRLDTPQAQRAAAEHILRQGLNVAQTEAYVESLLQPKPRKCRPTYLLKDVRLFLNTVSRGLSIMNAAGVKARCGREETEEEILLTIHIPKA